MSSLVPGETFRVLLVSAQEEARNALGEALAGRVDDHRLYWVSQADLAFARATDVLPHVVLVDDDLGGANPVTLIGQLAGKLPRTAILALVNRDAMRMAREAVLAGARGFVIKPVDGNELMAALRQVLAQRGASTGAAEGPTMAGRMIVFCAPKGGTGRTTLAINTAVWVATMANQAVALIDADYAAPALDVALNLDASRNIIRSAAEDVAAGRRPDHQHPWSAMHRASGCCWRRLRQI